jgi:hypothetical protein
VGLDLGDDTGSSLADFAIASPTPRPNASPLTGCPNTRLTKQPRKTTTKRRATFRFSATPHASSFRCKLDSAAFTACASPFSRRVGVGRHTFKVRAEDELAPASYSWKVVRG